MGTKKGSIPWNKNLGMKKPVVCPCGKHFITESSPSRKGRGIYCSVACRIKYSIQPKERKGYIINKVNSGWFTNKKLIGNKNALGNIPWCKGLKGIHLSPSSEFKSKDVSGKNNHNWKGGVTNLRDQIRHCFKYRLWRSDVFTRDNFTCQECSVRGGKLHAHHIKKFYIILEEYNIGTLEEAILCEELWNINNGQTLCTVCHDKKGRR